MHIKMKNSMQINLSIANACLEKSFKRPQSYFFSGSFIWLKNLSQQKSKRKSKPTTVKARKKLKQLKSSFAQKMWQATLVVDGVEAFQFFLF